MKSRKYRSIVSFGFAATLALTLAGCGKSSNVSEAEHLARAKAFQAEGQIQSQAIELKNILQKNPNHAEAHWMLGEVYSSLGYGKDAEKELVRAQDLGIDPEALKASLGKALLDQKEYKRVLNEIQVTPKSTPKTKAAVKTLYAQAELGQRQFEKGCELFREAKQIDPTYVPAYWGISQCALGYGKPIEAGDTIDKALEIEPKNAETWLLKGDLLRGQKNMPDAEKAYTTSLSYRAGHLATLLARASARIPLNDIAGAKEDIDSAEKLVKDHPLVLYFRGVLLFREKKYADAKLSFDAVLATNPGYAPALLWSGITDYTLNNLEQAGHSFSKYAKLVPNATEAKAFVALINARLGGKKAAKETLAALDKIDISDPQTLTMIGQAHLLTGDDQASSRFLARAVEKLPDAADPRMSLVAALLQQGEKLAALRQAEEFYKKSPTDLKAASLMVSVLLENRKIDEALDVVRQLQLAMPNSAVPHVYRAAIKADVNDIAAAKSELEKAHKIQPGNPLIGHSLAAIAILEKQFDVARRYYQQVSDKNDAPFETLMAMYDLEILAKQPGIAKKILEQTAAKFPRAARPATIIATAHVQNGQPDKALEASAQAAETNPDDVNLLTARGAAYYNKGDLTNALVQYQRIVRVRPDVAEGHFKVALIHNDKNDFISLRNDLQQVLRLDPKHLRAKVMLASLNLQDKKFEEALKLAKAVQQDDPTIAEGYVLESSALVMLNRQPEALTALDRGLKAAPSSDLPPIEIAKLQFNAGQPEAAFKAINGWLAGHPDNVRGNAFLAESLMAHNKSEDAVRIYEKILKLEPENPIALNNLANALESREPARALEYAERAYKRVPDDISVADTLGWLLLVNGQSKRALEVISKAFEAAPNAPEVQFHFAAALAQNGEKAKARHELEKLLGRKENFAVKQKAKALLDTL